MAEFDYKPGFARSLKENKEYRHVEREHVLMWLKPRKHEIIVDFGGGTGYVAEWIAPHCRHVLVLDPSSKLLRCLPKNSKLIAKKIKEDGSIPLPSNSVHAVFTVRAIHHVRNYHTVFSEFYRILKPNGRLLVCDIPEGSIQAKHFDSIVSLYCKAGHHRSWLNPVYFASLCKKHGFKLRKVLIEPTYVMFNSKEEAAEVTREWHDLSISIPKLIKVLEEHGLKFRKGKYTLPWPLLFGLAIKQNKKTGTSTKSKWWFEN